ncbi:MAG: UvrD-helicase domain-containing protein [Planctomycetota bacterium]
MSDTTLPDQCQRDRIATELDSTMLVEAAAGTGKTTSMIERMVALLEAGQCSVDTLAAVTFTRKAAAEMRSRFQAELERRARRSEGEKARRLAEAAEEAGRCFIGTIHSFCGRLLRERPVEAGVSPGFEQLEPEEDERLRGEAWQEFCDRLYARDDPRIRELADMGMDLSDLEDAFDDVADHPDVPEWPSEPSMEIPDAAEAARKISEYCSHVQEEVPEPEKYGSTERVLTFFRDLPWLMRCTDMKRLAGIERLMKKFDSDWKTCKTFWGGENPEEVREEERRRWENFRSNVAVPFLKALRQHRYRLSMDLLEDAAEVYRRRRRERNALNFQDLLLKAAELLREGGEHVRRYFQRSFTHLLVDEFQDTDPIQAEVMLLLTADDPAEDDWTHATPRPGSLFVVGDPKQSIYRFRRADLQTYEQVREIIDSAGGQVVQLSSNFRSSGALLSWVNRAFEPEFPDEPTTYSPAYVPLQSGKGLEEGAEGPEVQVLDIPGDIRRQDDIADYEAGVIARYIRRALDEGMTVRPPSEDGRERTVEPADFLVLTRVKARMTVYAQALQELGVPNQVTGGTVLNEVPELEQLHSVLRALTNPHNPVALLALLRGSAFGLDDPTLYRFREAGGEFDFRKPVPDELDGDGTEVLADIFGCLRTYRRWLGGMPPVAAIQRMASDLGLPGMAAAAQGGNVQAGSLGRAVELLRQAGAENWSLSAITDYLGELAESEEPQDGLPAAPGRREPMRIMNLHKAKGLEAPIVFLADPCGDRDPRADRHIDRSGDRTRGFLQITRRMGYHWQVLGEPPGWDECAEEEEAFLEAEESRLRYVAATRAGAKLIVCRRPKRKNKNPWSPLETHLQDSPSLEMPGEWSAEGEEAEEEPLEADEVRDAAADIRERRGTILRPGYRERSASGETVSKPTGLTGAAHGTEWGRVIHTLLEARMSDPEVDLEALARSEVHHQELPRGWAEDAVQTVQAVIDSEDEVWQRARRSERRLTEVPLRYCEDGDDGTPVMTRGILDLAFREDGGWVIVDYKTDDTDRNSIEDLVAHYAPQVEAYRAGWRRCVEEPVSEAGFFFTRARRYVSCYPSREA